MKTPTSRKRNIENARRRGHSVSGYAVACLGDAYDDPTISARFIPVHFTLRLSRSYVLQDKHLAELLDDAHSLHKRLVLLMPMKWEGDALMASSEIHDMSQFAVQHFIPEFERRKPKAKRTRKRGKGA